MPIAPAAPPVRPIAPPQPSEPIVKPSAPTEPAPRKNPLQPGPGISPEPKD